MAMASLETQIAYLHWRKVCNEQKLHSTLQLSKQLQERDICLRDTRKGDTLHRERMQQVLKDEFAKPFQVTAHFYAELTAQQRQEEAKAQQVSEKHLTQLHKIQAKLDAREATLLRKVEFARKKKELFASTR